jgi:arylsulfatase B
MKNSSGFLKIALSLAPMGLFSCESSNHEKPNILVIVVDDLGYADLSFLPQSPADVHTPNIDQVAAQGTYFSNAYSTAPICSPSRVGMITGQYQQRWGNYWYGEGGLPDSIPTIPQMLKEAGYHTYKIGKTHLNGGPVEHPLDHGFDEFLGFIDHTWDYLRLSQKDVDAYGEENAKQAHIGPLLHNREKVSYENGYTTDIFTDKAVEIIDSKQEKPFYIQLEYNAVHGPTYVCHPDYLEKFGLEQFPFWDPEKERYSDWHYRTGYLGEIDPDGRKRYLLQLAVLDDGIGRILESLKKTGKLKNTMIVFISDNGGDYLVYSDNTPLSGNKYMFGEGGLRVPLIVSLPARYEGNKSNASLVSGMDIFPTLMELAGVEVEHTLDGLSLTKLLGNENEVVHHESLAFSSGMNSYVVRKGPWRLNHYVGWRTRERFKIVDGICLRDTTHYVYRGGINLYNLDEDISETTDLSDQYPEVVKEMTSIYTEWESKMSVPRTGTGVPKPLPEKGEAVSSNIKSMDAQVITSNFRRDSYPGFALDGYAGTYWSTNGGNWLQPLPHDFTVKLKSPVKIKGISVLPRKGNTQDRIKEYTCSVSLDGINWKSVSNGILFNINNKTTIHFKELEEAKFVKLTALSSYDTQGMVSIAEFDLVME